MKKIFSIGATFCFLMATASARHHGAEICTSKWWQSALPDDVERVIKDPNYRCQTGAPYVDENIIHVAAVFASPAAFAALLNAGADADAKSSDRHTPLMGAAAMGRAENAKMLADAKVDLEIKGYAGLTPLLMAAQQGHAKVVRILIDAGANINAQDDRENTALMLAAHGGYPDVVTMLVQEDALINVINKAGFTALDFAEMSGHSDVAKILEAAGAVRNRRIVSRAP